MKVRIIGFVKNDSEGERSFVIFEGREEEKKSTNLEMAGVFGWADISMA